MVYYVENSNLTIQPGEVYAYDPGMAIYTVAISISGTSNLTNLGTIVSNTPNYGSGGVGGSFTGVFDNRGQVNAVANGEIGKAWGVSLELRNGTFKNSGTILAEALTLHFGFNVATGVDLYAIDHSALAPSSFENTGEIGAAAVEDAYGVNLFHNILFVNKGQIWAQGGNFAVGLNIWLRDPVKTAYRNEGSIVAESASGVSIGVWIDGMDEVASQPVFINTGTITADIAILGAESGGSGRHQMNVLNSGTLNGDVVMATADDIFANSGAIVGDIDMGEGDDKVDLRGGTINGGVHLWDGQDNLQGGAQAELAYGGAGNDVLRGGGGNDRLSGEQGDDLVYGDDGDDVLFGDTAKDELHGGLGHDLLTGGSADDVLYGEDGADVLEGGAGNDVLRGGDGHDVAFYALASTDMQS